jgi:phosphatidyl-myo-inositol dimannoside synthase
VTSETVLPGPRSQAERGHTAPRAGRVLLLAPSQGRGGGIERYVQTVQSAFDIAGVSTHRVNLSRPGPGGHRALYTEASAALAGVTEPTRVVASHRALLPVATALNRAPQVSGV